MSTEERRSAEPRTDEHHRVLDEPEQRPPTDKPEVTEEHRQKAKDMAKDYDDTRPTIVMPGTGGTLSGTAVNDWIDDDGNPRYGDEGDKKSTDTTDKA